MMGKITDFIKRERLYILLLVFIATANLITTTAKDNKAVSGSKASSISGDNVSANARDDIFLRQEAVEKALSKDKALAALFSLVSMLILAALVLGIIIDSYLLSQKLKKVDLDIATCRGMSAKWGIWDVGKVMILFLFLGYVIVIIESSLVGSGALPILKDDNFRMMLNSSIVDVLAVVLIIYFAVVRHKEGLASIGLNAKNFIKNVYYGIVGYIALVPVMAAVLAGILIVISITKYIPEKQPIVELFLKEKSPPFLIYTTVFAAIVGPVIEELFFRGFMYGALKKSTGVLGAMLITSSVFAALHTNVVGFLPIMALGILLAYLYEKTGTLVSSITVHAMHNLGMVFFVFLLKQLKV